MRILRIDMGSRTYQFEQVKEGYAKLGGRGLSSTIVHDEVPPTCHPLGPNNKLVFAPGIVTGTSAPTSARISVGGKSPLTGTIKETNAGSAWGPDLAEMRIKALIVQGQPKESGKYWIVRVWWDEAKGEPKVEFLPADEYVGKNLYEVFPKVFDRFGKVDVAGIGVAGEYRYGNSGICLLYTSDAADE